MAIKGLKELLKKIRDNADMTEAQVEEELNKSLPEDWVPKVKYNELSEAKKQVEKQAADNSKLLDDLKTKAGLSDEYKKQIEDLTAATTKAKAEYETKIKQIRFDTALEKSLSGAKARNATQVAKLIDRDKLKFNEDGTITGLDEMLTAMKKDSPYLFEEEQQQEGAQPNTPPKKPSFGGGGTTKTGTQGGSDDALRGLFGLPSQPGV
jgi:hypothetical protein